MTKPNRSDRMSWHLLNKALPIFCLVALGGIGYVLYYEVLIPMQENIEAIAKHMGINPKAN